MIPNGPESTLENFDLYTLANPPGETEMAMFDYHAHREWRGRRSL